MEVARLQPPPFPVQFKPDSPTHSFRKAPGVEWPAADVGLTHSSAPLVEWNLKTESETYLTTLEWKLHRLATPAADSGYASSSVFSPPSQPFAELEDDMVVEHGSYGGDGGDNEAESREGDGLLWGFARPAGSASGDSVVSRIDERDEPPSDVEHGESDRRHVHTPIHSTTGSPVQAYLIPPTPSSTDEQPGSNDDREDAPDGPEPTTLEFRVPSTLVDTRSRRISFNSSVRISGGIGGRKSQPRAGADLFSPPPTFEKTRSASTSSTHSLPPNAHSRSGSPTAAHGRAGSSGSQQQPFQLSGYSSTATSAVPSRSSSPCSSIYAPLQPPSATCPSPMLVRPPPKRKSLTFTEYLRGRADDNEETAVRGYRDLVEAQRRKKTQWEQRRAVHARGGRGDHERSKLADGGDTNQPEGLWDKIKQMLASGAAGTGRRGGRSYSHYGGVDSTKRGPRRDSDDDDAADDDEDDEEADRRVSTRGRGRGGRPPRRKPSALSLSSVSDADDEGDSRDAHSIVSDDDEGFYADLPPSSRRMEKPKTPADVMFGPAPTRWSRWDWWVWKVRAAAASVYGDCFGRSRSEDEEETI